MTGSETAACTAVPRPDTGTAAERGALRVEAAGATDVGRRRVRNEDAFTVVPVIGLFAVADGLGARPDGQVASALAVESVTKTLRKHIPSSTEHVVVPAGDVSARVVAALNRAHNRIRREATGPRLGMATTFAGVLVSGDAVCIAHVGDSRVYRLREGTLAALTDDHVLANELLTNGVPLEDVLARRDRFALTRVLGSLSDHTPSVRLETARPGDVLLVCSDGLHNMVPSDELEQILLRSDAASVAVERLIQCANNYGGRDNITAVVVRWEGAS